MLSWLFLAGLSVTSVAVCDAKKTAPHIIFILADDLGWADTSLYGSTQIPTPNLDALASTGVLFNNYYVQPLCSPTRAALMTGLYPVHNGVYTPLQPAMPGGLPLRFKLLPQYLKDLGYEAHMVGKWHLGYSSLNLTPTYRGFESFFGFYTGPTDYYYEIEEFDGRAGLDFWNNTDAFWPDGSTYATTMLTERAKFIIGNRDKTKPLFLYLPHQAAHGVYEPELVQAPEENVKKFSYISDTNRTIYAGMVDALDQSVGVLLEALEEAHMLDDTVLVFSSDNGGDMYSGGRNFGLNWPLRGGKGTAWEGGIRAASFVWSSRLARRGAIAPQLMHIVDWLPTIYFLAGGNVASLGPLDGKNIWQTVSTGAPSVRFELLNDLVFTSGTAALRYGNFKLVVGGYPEEESRRFKLPAGSLSCQDVDVLLRTSRTAAVLRRFYGDPNLFNGSGWCKKRQEANVNCAVKSASSFDYDQQYYLFDLAQDPCEQRNLASVNPALLSFMLQRLNCYNKTAAPQPMTAQDPRGFPENNNGIWAPWIF
ncbi:arylsulfatase B-like [Amblyomma americanum]